MIDILEKHPEALHKYLHGVKYGQPWTSKRWGRFSNLLRSTLHGKDPDSLFIYSAREKLVVWDPPASSLPTGLTPKGELILAALKAKHQ